MDNDVAPKVGDTIERVGATLIAKHKTYSLDDQNEYVVLCLIVRPEDSTMPIEYVTWHLYANQERFELHAGHYYFDKFVEASEGYAKRAGLKSYEEANG